MPVVNTRQINGVVRTSEPVWSNLERLAEACTSWFTYDVHTGLYSWVINEAGNSVASISEADIIGPIQISGSGLSNLYNSIEIEYPNTDIRDQPHYVRLELPSELRNAYEPDNTLQVTSEFINNQPQAEYSALVNLKQSRLDRTITINMDYTKINLRAGDIIDVTSATYGWTGKEFRIMRVREIEGDDGSLRLEFNCSEYDDTIYDGTWSEFLVGGPPGIISIGAIGQAGTPVGNIINVNGVPLLTVTSTVPTGIVDRMQFWAGNISITGNVANTAFNLIGTVASTNANALTANSAAVYSTASLSDGLYAFKTRGVNVNGTGAFSNVSANVNWSSANIVANTIGNVSSNTVPSNVVIANIANNTAITNAIGVVIANSVSNGNAGNVSLLVNYQSGINMMYSGNATAGVLANIVNVWYQNTDISFNSPANSNCVIQVFQNGAAEDAWYANAYPNTNRVMALNLFDVTSGSTLLKNTSDYGDAYDDLDVTATIDFTTSGTKTIRVQSIVEQLAANRLGVGFNVVVWRRPL